MAKSISRTLIIGIGGTGQRIMREIKKNILQRYDEIPNIVQFIAYDTDELEAVNEPFKYVYKLENKSTYKHAILTGEYQQLKKPTWDDIIDGNIESCRYLNMKYIKRGKSLLAGGGANGIRVMGRAYLLFNEEVLVNELSRIIKNIKNVKLSGSLTNKGYSTEQDGNLSIYIIGSLAGGTGSGVLLDIPQMLKVAGATVNDYIFGVFILPEYFSGKNFVRNRYINAYTALSELDYCHNEDVINNRILSNYYNGAIHEVTEKLYSNVFLIDQTISNGQTIEFDSMKAYVGGYIANSICSSNDIILSAFVNATHAQHTIKNKALIYSSISYTELVFLRDSFIQHSLYKMIQKQLESFTKGNQELDVETLVQTFIEEKGLNEGKNEDEAYEFNQLIDQIYLLEDEVFDISFKAVPTGKDAFTKISTFRDDFINNLKQKTNTKLEAFESKKDFILSSLDSTLKDLLLNNGGTVDIKSFVNSMFTAFEMMKIQLEKEVANHKEIFKTIEKNNEKIINKIKEKSSKGWWPGGNKLEEQEILINNFKRKVSGIGTNDKEGATLKRLLLQMVRKEAAINVYESLLEIIQKYYEKDELTDGEITEKGEVVKVAQRIEEFKAHLQRLIISYNPAPFKDHQIFLDYYLKGAIPFDDPRYNSNVNLSDNFKSVLRKSKIENWDEEVFEIVNYFKTNLPNTHFVKKLMNEDEFPIDKVFLEIFGDANNINNPNDLDNNPQLKIIKQIGAGLNFLWQHIPVMESVDGDGVNQTMPPECHIVIGSFDENENLFSQQFGYNLFLDVNIKDNHTSTGDPNKIIFLGQETAIPAFKLSSSEKMKNEFKNKKNATYSFSDTRLEDIDMINPEDRNKRAEEAWAYAWMFDIIKYDSGRVKIKTSLDFNDRNNKIVGSDGLLDYFKHKTQKPSEFAICFKHFASDNNLVNDVYDQIDKIRRSEIDETKERISIWISDQIISSKKTRNKEESAMSKKELQLLTHEKKILADSFEKLNKDGRKKIEYRDGKVIVS